MRIEPLFPVYSPISNLASEDHDTLFESVREALESLEPEPGFGFEEGYYNF